MQVRQALVWTALCVATASAQQHPDFTGTWRSVGDSNSVTIQRVEHRDTFVKLTRETHQIPAGSLDRPLASMYDAREFEVDGPEQVEQQRWRSAHWEGASLVISTVSKNSYRVTATREVWHLEDEGRALLVSTRVVDMDGVRETVRRFRRD
jgi:hypothetical protein